MPGLFGTINGRRVHDSTSTLTRLRLPAPFGGLDIAPA